jgi:hypothetical protein
MTADKTSLRRAPRTTIASGWTGATAVTNATVNHSQLAQHQLCIACVGGKPGSGTVTVSIRPIGFGLYVDVGTINLATSGSGRLLFSGFFDAVCLTSGATFGAGITASAQLDSTGEDFIVAGPFE